MSDNLIVSVSPHIHRRESTASIMWKVAIALIPAGIFGAWFFGARALLVILSSIASALISEAAIQYLRKQKITVLDGSAFLTGLLVAYNLPPGVPLWLPAAGSFFAIAIAKQAFGGLGMNIFNPALAGRVFLMAAWPHYMTKFTKPFDALTAATPLALLKEGKSAEFASLHLSNWDMFIGARGGCIGEVCIIALLLGALFLLARRIIYYHAPLAFLAVVGILSFVFSGDVLFRGDWIFALLSGGLILGAFFMATDYVTTPLTAKGQFIFGIGCGIITFVIRKWGGYPEGVSYSILIMNAATPLIDRYIKPKRFA